MKDIKNGEYVRTKYGSIRKIINLETYCNLIIETDKGDLIKDNITKTSPNIIDLIEVGDVAVVNCVKYTIVRADDMFDGRLFIQKIGHNPSFTTIKYLIEKKELQAIVTKEQFSQMEYRIGE